MQSKSHIIANRLYLSILVLTAIITIPIFSFTSIAHVHDSLYWNKYYGEWYLSYVNLRDGKGWEDLTVQDQRTLRTLSGHDPDGGPWEGFWSKERALDETDFDKAYWGSGKYVSNFWIGLGLSFLWLLPLIALIGLKRWFIWAFAIHEHGVTREP